MIYVNMYIYVYTHKYIYVHVHIYINIWRVKGFIFTAFSGGSGVGGFGKMVLRTS